MAKTLRDQLLKTGLATRKQVSKAEKAARNRRSEEPDVVQAEAARQSSSQRAAKTEHDRELNRQREARLAERANQAAIQQLIADQRLERKDGEVSFNFKVGKRVARIWVSEEQRRRLAKGELGIVQPQRSPEARYELVPAATARKIAERNAQCLLLLIDPAAAVAEDPWSDVPDDAW